MSGYMPGLTSEASAIWCIAHSLILLSIL